MAVIEILFVNDDPNEYAFLKDLFNSSDSGHENYNLSWSSNSEEALERIIKGKYDVYIVDHKPGSFNGLELIGEAKSRGCGAPFIMLASYAEHAVDQRAQEIGVDEFINKRDLNYLNLERSIRYSLERKKTESLFMEQQAKLLKSIKMSMLGELISGVSHEINNPIALLNILLANMTKRIDKDKYTKEDLLRLVGKAEHAIKRLSKITSSLTRYSRNTTNDPLEKVKLSVLIEESVEICIGKMRAKKVRLDFKDIDKDLVVSCRPGEIVQVFVNILNNAVDAISDLESKWVNIWVETSGQTYKVVFQDSGENISKEVLEQIYTPFFTTKKRDGGTGLGLSISKSIMDFHGGAINFNTDNANIQVEVCLPIDSAAAFNKKPHCILLIDNEENDMSSLIKDVLEKKEYSVFISATLSSAKDIINKNIIDKVVMDFNVKNFKFKELFEFLEQKNKNTNVGLVGSVYNLSAIDFTKYEMNFKVFQKPFDASLLIDFCSES